MKKYAISDIHGCIETFKALIAKIKLTPKDELFILGDYIDRGPDSKGVIDYIWQLQEEGFSVKCLLGNHEAMLLEQVKVENPFYKGNQEVRESFGVGHIRDIPKQYLNWMKYLHLYFEVNEYILVHAGLNFKSNFPLQQLQEMIWIRKWYEDINYDWLGDRIVIHGHTPIRKNKLLEIHANMNTLQVLNIDNGCFFESDGMGSLCCFEMTERKLFFQKNID